jgi:hypothetical protein
MAYAGGQSWLGAAPSGTQEIRCAQTGNPVHPLTTTPICEPLFLAPDNLQKLLTNLGKSARDGEKRPPVTFGVRTLGIASATRFRNGESGERGNCWEY